MDEQQLAEDASASTPGLVGGDAALLMADLCHQVRTPLNGILGTLELLLQGDLDDDAYELARVAYDSAVALHRVFEADLRVAIRQPA